PAVPAGLPAQLLARRPDVAEAEQVVVAANAQIGVATADFYPRFTLTTSAGFESANVETLFSWQSRVASILPSISFPIFEGGRLRASLAATKAGYEQAVAAYVNQVLIAYGDVEDALTDLRAFSDEVGTQREAVGASQNYLHLAPPDSPGTVRTSRHPFGKNAKAASRTRPPGREQRFAVGCRPKK